MTQRSMQWLGGDPEPLLTREWLVTNGLGGYASGTISGAPTRRYHGLLIAALPAPLGRMMMLGNLRESLREPGGQTSEFSGEERTDGRLTLGAAEHLRDFHLEQGLPVWRFQLGEHVIEKTLFLPHLQNTVLVRYRLLAGSGTLRLKLRPTLHLRNHDAHVSSPLHAACRLTAVEGRYEIDGVEGVPPLRLRAHGARTSFSMEPQTLREFLYRVEASRGYDHSGDVWSPGFFRADLTLDSPLWIVASTEPWPILDALSPEEALEAELGRRHRLVAAAHPAARTGPAAELVLAADQFLIDPSRTRAGDAARAHAEGHEARSVIAGYHWFTDWGRDTMISLEGLALTTGRGVEAGWILRTFARYVRDGLIPNFFPDGENEGVYHTADASLWFFHAVDRYLEVTGDREILHALLPPLSEIVRAHLAGTRFGIGVDPSDGLLRQGAAGYQLTWMDAKVGDWVVTPRRGKAVEINALWYNALRLLGGWQRAWLAGEIERGQTLAATADWQPDALDAHAERCRQSFAERFWYEPGGHLYDVVDGEDGRDDPAVRPNQLFTFSLRHAILAPERWPRVLQVVQEQLVTPVGLRSLGPSHADYKARYFGDLRARDAAYHQGTVWGWLIGPFVDAWLKCHPADVAGARAWLEGYVPHLSEACVGSISEVFDAEAPYTPRACIAQAWSVAEVLRCWVKTAPPSDIPGVHHVP